MFLRIWVVAVLSIALGACAGAGPAETLASGAMGAEPARYDAVQAELLVQDAQAAAAQGDLAAAEVALEGALDSWPISKPAWDGLAEIYHEQGRQADLDVANFFAARMDWVATLPPLVASDAFENVAKGRVEIAQDNPELRRRSAELVVFLRTREAQDRDASYYEEIEFWKLAPAAIVSAGVAVFWVGSLVGYLFTGS